MQKRFSLFAVLVIALIFSAYHPVPAQKKKVKSQPPAPVVADIQYTVSMPRPWTHLLEVEMRFRPAKMPAVAELKMPVWTPGSYLIREYARHIQRFEATNTSLASLDWKKSDKNTWQIETGGAPEIIVKYDVYANELTVRTNELNAAHAFFTPAALLMFPKDHLDNPSTIKVVPYGNWKVATGLPAIPQTAVAEDGVKMFRAANFDILYDSPFEVSDFVERKFDVMTIPHRYVITGEGNYDLDKMTKDTGKIIEQTAAIFGELPYDDYLFILNLRGGGGLEHLNSTALQWNRFGFEPADRYKSFLGLVAHEYFHLFNVKRIRPDALGPFNYETENYTKLLWVAEGATSHFEYVLMRRADLVSAQEVLESKATIIESLQRTPGRFETSLEDASFDAWIKYYRQDENSVNNQISYYSKGELVNFLLDIEILSASGGTKSLDHVMRYLYDEFYKKGKNYGPADYQHVAELMAGVSLDHFFEDYVRGTADIDYNATLNKIGLRLITRQPESDKGYFGANLRNAPAGVTVSSVPADTPAYEWGLNADDLIIAVDGYQISDPGAFSSYIGQKKAGEKIRISFFRHNNLRDLEVTLGKTPAGGYAIVPVEAPSDEQKALYKQYLLADLK